MFARGFSCDISCEAVKMHCGEDGIEDLIWSLRDEARDHAGEDVAGPSGCHAWITGGIHPDSAIRVSYESAVAFKDKNQLMLAREAASDVQAIVLHSRSG